MPHALGYTPRWTFWAKVVAAAALTALADILFFDREPGSTVGAFALAVIAAMAAARPSLWRDRRALLALTIAAGFAAVQLDRPGVLASVLFLAAIGTAATLPLRARLDDGWRWSQRLFFMGLIGLVGPILDFIRVYPHVHFGRTRIWTFVRLLALPVIGALVFAWLFSAANPIIDNMLAQIHWTWPRFELARLIFWGFVATGVWVVLRPRRRTPFIRLASGKGTPPGVSVASVTLSLVVFNLLFAVQNALDVAFLWSGAALPDGVTLAEYAHRGAYPLIATALLAGLFVLVTLKPGSETAARPLIRRLVALWVAQNVFLVASSVLRTLDYIDAYSLTRLRIAALIWMGLVATGLGLILWRLLKAKSAEWLVSANLLAAGAVLAACSVADLGAIAAHWNVRHAREAGGRGAALDLCYLRRIGPAALVPLVELERSTFAPDLADRVAAVRADIQDDMADQQGEWRGWRWRDARRLARVEAMMAGRPWPQARPGERTCDGRLLPPPQPRPPVPTAPQPLTPAARP